MSVCIRLSRHCTLVVSIITFSSSFFSRSPSSVDLSLHRFLSILGLFPVTFSVFFSFFFDSTRNLLSHLASPAGGTAERRGIFCGATSTTLARSTARFHHAPPLPSLSFGSAMTIGSAKWQNFANFWRARSRLYQNEILQENMRLTAFFKL